MKPMKTFAFLCALLFSATWTPLLADEIRMKNGDRISGRVISMDSGTLTVETEYAGKIAIRWNQVEALQADSPVHIVLEDETRAHGMLKTTSDGILELDTDDVTRPLEFLPSRVAAINPPITPPAKITGRVNAGLDVKKGNTDTEAYHVDTELVARTEKNRYTLGGEANREEESGVKTADNWLAYTSYDHFLSEKWFLYTNASFEKDDFKDLSLRTTLGAGSGYQFYETALRNLSAEAGISYVNEDYDVNNQDDDYAAGRWSVKFDRYLFDKFFQLFHHHEGIVSLEDTEQVVIRARTGVRIPLRNGFNTTLQYNWDWDNSPAAGNDRVDERYLFTLGYSWE